MRIAIISYELPPSTGGGGIGTYLTFLASMLLSRGNDVEVFAGAGAEAEGSWEELGTLVHRFGRDPKEFLASLGERVAERHLLKPFDVAEAPEFMAQAAPIRERIPDLPVLVKLHTPAFLIEEFNAHHFSISQRIRWCLGALKRMRWPKPLHRKSKYLASADLECETAQQADLVVAPSQSIGEILIEKWSLPPNRVEVFPNLFRPASQLLQIPIERNFYRVTFIGRLEERKGILELAQAIPLVLRKFPCLQFRFIGKSHPSPDGRGTMQNFLECRLSRWMKNLEFTGGVPYEQLPRLLGESDICVLPSRWENFPNVCMEAMAAGCGVVGSQNGGMVELLEEGRCGVLVNPHSPGSIADGICSLLEDPEYRMQLAQAARERVLSEYSFEKLGPVYDQAYRRAVQNARRRAACLS